MVTVMTRFTKSQLQAIKISMLILLVIIMICSTIMFINNMIKKRERKKLLMYTINYNGINCLTPELLLYSDNTYEYYYSFTAKDEELIAKSGKYNYDVKKIIENIDKYEENRYGPYYIKDSEGKEYITYNSNKELQALLHSIDVTLEKCLVEQ